MTAWMAAATVTPADDACRRGCRWQAKKRPDLISGHSAASPTVAVPPKAAPRYAAAAKTSTAIVTARKPKPHMPPSEGVTLTHPDRELWPGITKQHLAEYWQAVAEHALPGLAHRPAGDRALPRRHRGASISSRSTAMATLPDGIRTGEAGGRALPRASTTCTA